MNQKEIAKKLNVSQAAVSMALNRDARISAKLQEKIIAMATKSGYQPNMAGRTLRRRKSNIIAMILPSVANRFYSELFQGLQNNLYEHGYLLFLLAADFDRDQQLLLAQLRQLNVAGIIAFGNFAPWLLQFHTMSTPLIFYGGDSEIDAPVSQVLPDREQATFDLIKLLIGKGCRRIAFLGMANENEPRYKGYCRALESAEIALRHELITGWINGMKCGYESMNKLLISKPFPDAVFCHNDEMAIGAKRALADAGLKIPGDVALAGFDNIEVGGYLSPSLTSVEQPMVKIVGALVKETIDSIKNINHHRLVKIPCHVILREST